MGDSIADDGKNFVRPGCCLRRWDGNVLIFHLLFVCVRSSVNEYVSIGLISGREEKKKRRKKKPGKSISWGEE